HPCGSSCVDNRWRPLHGGTQERRICRTSTCPYSPPRQPAPSRTSAGRWVTPENLPWKELAAPNFRRRSAEGVNLRYDRVLLLHHQRLGQRSRRDRVFGQ